MSLRSSLLVLTFLSAVSGFTPRTTSFAADFAEHLPRIAPTEPSETLPDFRVADGYEIRLVASEPLINSPVAIEWAADGALFVCEMRGYSEDRDDGLSRITRLTDIDDDGVYDRQTVFADGLFWPTALFPYDGGLFVADAPDILYLKDDDGDGIADSKRVVFTGFSTGNVQGLVNCFRWGLDNRIHLACGTVGGKVSRVGDDPSAAVEVRGHDFAFDPRTLEFSLTSGGGQHGMCFDDWGRKFVSSNSDHLQQVMYEDRYVKRNPLLAAPSARQSIAADGPQAEVFRISPVEPWRIVRTRLRVAGLARGPIEGGGRAAGYFTGATGVTIYRGDAWPESDHGLAIVGDVGSNLVHRKRLSADTSVQLVGRRIDPASEFVASKDIWFRPAQFACGPDGTLSVIDVYREVIEHPKSLPPDIKRHLDLTSGRNRGRIYRVVPTGYRHRTTSNLNGMSDAELVSILGHANAWHRETASRLLYERRSDSAEPLLRDQLRTTDRALARLHSMSVLDGMETLTPEDVRDRFADSNAHVVRYAVLLAERFPDSAAIHSGLRDLVDHPSIDVRYQLAWSLGGFDLDDKPSLLVSLLRSAPDDRWINTAVLGSSYGIGDRLLGELLSSGWDDSFAAVATTLARQIDRRGDLAARRRAVAAVVDAEDSTSLLPIIRTLVGTPAEPSLGEDLLSKADQKTRRLVEFAIKIVADDDRPDAPRAAEIERLSGNSDRRFVAALSELVEDSDSAELLIASVKALGATDGFDREGSDSIIDGIVARWPQWSPRVRAAVGDVLFANDTRSLTFLRAIQEGEIQPEDLSLVRWKLLSSSENLSVREIAAKYLQATSSSRQSVLDEYQSVLEMKGDPLRGRTVFKKQCAACHRAGELGNEIGPNLAAAATRGASSILANVLDPNREVNPQYVNFVVLTTDGKSVAGMISSENANSVTLTAAESVTTTLLRRDIELIRNTNQSIMPEGFERTIPKASMADLIAFLVNEMGLPGTDSAD